MIITIPLQIAFAAYKNRGGFLNNETFTFERIDYSFPDGGYVDVKAYPTPEDAYQNLNGIAYRLTITRDDLKNEEVRQLIANISLGFWNFAVDKPFIPHFEAEENTNGRIDRSAVPRSISELGGTVVPIDYQLYFEDEE